jgi:hypothetical protein
MKLVCNSMFKETSPWSNSEFSLSNCMLDIFKLLLIIESLGDLVIPPKIWYFNNNTSVIYAA